MVIPCGLTMEREMACLYTGMMMMMASGPLPDMEEENGTMEYHLVVN